MNKKFAESVKVIPFPGIENAYVIISFRKEESGIDWLVLNPSISFLYDAGKVAAEWEVRYGPIQRWYKCDEDAEGAEPHYFYDYQNSPPGSWSQLAVEREMLKESLLEGRYDYIFAVLKRWAED